MFFAFFIAHFVLPLLVNLAFSLRNEIDTNDNRRRYKSVHRRT